MGSVIRVSATAVGVLALTVAVGLASPVHAQFGASILKNCEGPGGQGMAFVGDTITCSIEVENTKPNVAEICMTSIVDVIVREGATECAGDACHCFNPGQPFPGATCVAQSDCLPLTGSDRGVCARDVTENLLPCDGVFTCAGGGADGNPCTDSSQCPDGTCCVRLDLVAPKVTCNHLETVEANDNDPLLDEAVAKGIDLSTAKDFTLRFQASLDTEDLSCGDSVTDPCLVQVNVMGVDKAFCEEQNVNGCTDVSLLKPALQAAIDAAAEGATITVNGRCSGPIRVIDKDDLTITGVLPEGSTACQNGESARRQDLRSTIAGGCDTTDVSECELVKMTNSDNVTVQYLNIIDSFNSGLEYKRSKDGLAFCNCIARSAEDGIEFDKGKGRHIALQNLVWDNAQGTEEGIDAGIRVHDSSNNTVRGNVVLSNREGGILVEDESDETLIEGNTVEKNTGNGIHVIDSNECTVKTNVVKESTLHGIHLENADETQVISNVVTSNSGNGLRLRRAQDNVLGGLLGENDINANATGSAADQVVCESKSKDNTGTNKINGVPGVGLPATCL